MTIKIPVSADTSQVTKGLESAGKTVENLERQKKWSPVDVRRAERDIKKVEQMILDMRKRLGNDMLGVAPLTTPGNFGPPGGSPPRGVTSPASGGRRPRHRYHVTPDLYDIPHGFLGSLGGGVGQIGTAGLRGAMTGAGGGGGMLGGSMGLLKGLGIGSLAFGAIKAGQGVNEGYDLYKDRAITLDSLKRQMGDLGVSFEILTQDSKLFSQGLAVNSKEFAELAQEMNRASGGADKTEEGLFSSTRTAASVAKAYGTSESESVRFFGGMRHIDPKQDNRELALLLGETINRSGMFGRPEEVMQALKSFAEATSRISLNAPNMPAFAGAYTDLVSSKTPGLTSEVAANILSTASASVARGGSAGEAGQFFNYQALRAHGDVSPVEAAALMQGGLFGTRSDVFGGKNNPLTQFLGKKRMGSMAGGAGAGVTNFEAIRSKLLKEYSGRQDLMLDAAQRVFGLSSIKNTAALMGMDGTQIGGISKMMRDAGANPSSFNERGMDRLIKIGVAKDRSGLTSVYDDLVKNGNLTDDERGKLDSASKGSDQELRDALFKVAALKDQSETVGKQTVEGLAAIKEAEMTTGEKLLGPLIDLRNAMIVREQKTPEQLSVEAQKIRWDAETKANPTGGTTGAASFFEMARDPFGTMFKSHPMSPEERQKIFGGETPEQIPSEGRAPEKISSTMMRGELDVYINQRNMDGSTTELSKERARLSTPRAAGAYA